MLATTAAQTLLLLLSFGCGGSSAEPSLEELESAARATLDRARGAVAVARERPGVATNIDAPSGRYDSRVLALTEALASARSVDLEPRGDDDFSRVVVGSWAFPDGGGRQISTGEQVVLDVDPVSGDVVGAIRLRVETRDSAYARVRVELEGKSWPDGIVVRHELVSDGTVREYLIDLRQQDSRRTVGPVESLRVELEAGEAVRVHSVELLSRWWQFIDDHGLALGRVGDEARPSIYVRGSGTLTFDVSGRWQNPMLHFGLALAVPGRPRHVSVLMDGGKAPVTLAEYTVAETAAWTDHEVSIGSIPEGRARLSLVVHRGPGPEDPSDEGGVVLWGSPVLWEPPRERLNILLILEDALRADRMSLYGHSRNTTPYKERLFSRGIRFGRSISQATKTRFSCPSLMTSLRPFATGVYGTWDRHVRLADAHVTLPEILARHGWATGSFHQNANAGSDNGLHQGFERMVENIEGRADAVYGGRILEWLRTVGDRNFFAYLHVADPHAPYQPPPEHRRWFDSLAAESGGHQWQDDRWVTEARRALYDGEVASNDAALPLLIAQLESLNLLDDTLLIFVADHGEHLGEHDLWDHRPPSYLQVVHVPLLIRHPQGVAAGAVVDQVVQNLDVTPTILDLADIDVSGYPFQGRSLRPLLIPGNGLGFEDEAVIVQDVMTLDSPDDDELSGSVLWGRWHFLRSAGVGPVLFDLDADPAEEHPLRPSPAVEQRCLALLAELRSLDSEVRMTFGDGSSGPVIVDPGTIENLVELGYLPR